MSAELLMRSESVLRPGFHGPQIELDFVGGVYRTIRDLGYLGPIALIGSRAKGEWISENSYFDATRHIKGLNHGTRMYWYERLNELAKIHNYCSAQIPLLADEIQDAPQDIIDLVRFENPAADWDLMLKVRKRPSGVEECYFSDELGLIVDVSVEGEGFGFRKK
ncbi:MAG: hypothetical protein WC744_05325 [Patescibacteria group bacterium]|jgi:hypothetical protein